ncbi:MAG: Ig-like domain-containing protein [Mycobacterium sp.]
MTHTTAPRAARYIGRVGALAFGLGVWAVISGPAASADTDAGNAATHRTAASAPQPSAAKSAGGTAAKSVGATAAPQSTAFAGTPRLAYNAAQNTQDADGVINGDVNGSQADGYTLQYSVTGAPARGAVDLTSEGGFTYTPTTDFAAVGGTDTFGVTADDRSANPRHWHGLATLTAPNEGHTATDSITVLENPGAPIPPSVLATTDQLNAEKLATELAGSPLVGLAKLVLKAGWMLAAHNNFDAVGGPDATNMNRLDQALTEYATQAALEVQLLNSAEPKVIQQVAPPHDWYQQSFPGSRIWYDNPDTIYRFIGVNSASSYVITGRFPGDMPADTNFSVLTGLNGTTAANLNGRDMVINPDGTFTITASADPATPGQPNHLQLAPGTTLITTRNTLANWNAEEPMSLSVSKVSGPPPSLFSQIGGFAFPGIGPVVTASPALTQLVSLIPPLPAPRLVQELETAAIMLLLGISGENKYMAVATTDPKTGERRAPNVLSDPDRNAEFLATQLQSAGYFQLTDSQALVVTVDPGNARYFNVPVTDDWTITGNYWDQQTSLNKSQAVANPDGTYTFVIAKNDPGGPNWISTGGLNQGTISIRFQDFDPASSATPTVSSQVIQIEAAPEQRQSQIAQRQLGYYRRWAPYPQA